MPDCTYCGESFEDEDAYLAHLGSEHDASELSRIDRRRVESHADEDEGEFPTGPVVIVGVVLFSAALIAYVSFFMGGSGTAAASGSDVGAVAKQPGDPGGVHEHGTIDVTIDGRTLDFSRAKFQHPRENPAFHFEAGNGRMWHKHATGVTLEYAMSTLGIDMNRTAVRYDGEVYRDGDPGTNVTVLVDGEPVDPRSYVLTGASERNPQRGDHVRIVVETDGQ